MCIQVMLINSAKDVASALSHLVNSAKNASGKQGSDPAMAVLKDSAKVNWSDHYSTEYDSSKDGIKYSH